MWSEEKVVGEWKEENFKEKLMAVVVIFIILVSLVGCGRRDLDADESHSPGRPNVSDGTEAIADNAST